MLLGQFELHCPMLRVTDPCYSINTWCQGVLSNCRQGKWNAYIQHDDGRVAELMVVHESIQGMINSYATGYQWRRVHDFEVGVDSGQAGFFDDAFYPRGDSTGEYGDLSTFYGKACEATTEGSYAGILTDASGYGYAVVSSSGYGDGSYDLFVIEREGLVVAARIVFIAEEDEDEFDDELFEDEDEDEYPEDDDELFE